MMSSLPPLLWPPSLRMFAHESTQEGDILNGKRTGGRVDNLQASRTRRRPQPADASAGNQEGSHHTFHQHSPGLDWKSAIFNIFRF